MSISYGLPVHKSRGQKFASQALNNFQALSEHFRAEGINILSESIADIIGDATAFEDYKERLVEGASESVAEELRVLAENVRMDMLQESMISGINPITALSLPILRVGFPKMAVREGVPTEPVEQPKFKVTTKRQYVIDPTTREKLYLPGALVSRGDLFNLPQLAADAIAVTGGSLSSYDLLSPIGKNASLGDEIDPDFSITEVTVSVGTDTDAKQTTVPVTFALDTNINIVTGSVTVQTVAGVDHKVEIIAKVDRSKGLLNAAAIGGILVSLKVRGYISSEMNNASTQIGFDITGQDITVGTGQPIESPVSIQQMTDVMAMYQVDATMSHLETMSTVLAHTIDLRGVRFIKDTFAKDPSSTETFDVVPPANYALGDAAWREQLKIKFDRLVTKLQTRNNIYSGHAVIFAHPLDAQVVSNVKWVYSTDEQPNDVAVDFKVGNFQSGITSYTLLQSPYFTQGEFYVLFVPAETDFRTCVYFPYSFTTTRGAASPNNPNLPAIQMISRQCFKDFTPMVGKITISNNA